MKKKNALALLLMVVAFYQVYSAYAENVSGSTAESKTFYVSVTDYDAYIELRSYQGIANVEKRVALFITTGHEQENHYGFYKVIRQAIGYPTSTTYRWVPSATRETKEAVVFDYSEYVYEPVLRVYFQNKGNYIITVEPENGSLYWREDVLESWAKDATWIVTETYGCTVSNQKQEQRSTIIYFDADLEINYYLNGVFYEKEKKPIHNSDYFTPKPINGYSCTSGGQYVTYFPLTGTCSPSSIDFYYNSTYQEKDNNSTKQEYNVGFSINHYGTDGVWLSGRAEVLSLSPGSYTIKPDYESISYNGDTYTLTGTRSYVLTVYSDGSTSKTGYEFYFQKQNNNSNTYSDSNNVNALYGLAKEKLATRYGPSTSYAEGGTFFVKGQYIKVLSRSYDKVNEIWWVKCEIPDNGTTRILWTGYKRFDSSTLPLESIPIE